MRANEGADSVPPNRSRGGVYGCSHFTTAISRGELLYGAERRRSARLREAIEALLAAGPAVLPFDSDAAMRYGAMRADLERDGRRLDEPDLRIASIALSRGLTLVTGNVRHFARVPGLELEDWVSDEP